MRIEWPTVGMIALAYGGWAAAGLWLWPVVPALALAIMAVLAALHSSLTHECLHGHPTRSRTLNEALVTLPLSLVYPYRRYRAMHLAHHHDERLTDPFDDPESYYKARFRLAAMPAGSAGCCRSTTPCWAAWCWDRCWAQAGSWPEARGLWHGARGVRLAWALHALSLVPVLAALALFGIPIWLYVLAVVWPALGLISIRTFAEHRWHETPEGRTIIVERSPLAWLFLNNNLHIVHHQHPQAPWYALPRLYRARKEHWQALNGGYVYRSYWDLFRAHALRAKEPVAHPALRIFPETPHVPRPAAPRSRRRAA
jgi:fatty acid desaturase